MSPKLGLYKVFSPRQTEVTGGWEGHRGREVPLVTDTGRDLVSTPDITWDATPSSLGEGGVCRLSLL